MSKTVRLTKKSLFTQIAYFTFFHACYPNMFYYFKYASRVKHAYCCQHNSYISDNSEEQ